MDRFTVKFHFHGVYEKTTNSPGSALSVTTFANNGEEALDLASRLLPDEGKGYVLHVVVRAG